MTTSSTNLVWISYCVASAPLSPPRSSGPTSLDRVVPIVVDRFELLHHDLDVPDAPLSPEVGDEEHVPYDVDGPGVSWAWLSHQDRREESREPCTFVRWSCDQCYLA